MAAVYKRGATWWIRFTWRGQEIRRSAKTVSKTVAQRYLAKVLEEHRRLDRGERPHHTLDDALVRYRADYLPTLKPATRQRYEISLRQIAPALEGCLLSEVTKARLAEIVTSRRRAGASASTIRRDLTALSSVLSFAAALDMIEANPISQFSKRHLREPVPKTTYPSDAEIEHLVAHASPMMGRVILFLAQTGMRLEEAVSMEWSQVYLDRQEVLLTRTKTSSPRVVPLSVAALSNLATAPRHPNSPYVFWHGNGERYLRFSGHFRRLAQRVGFRHRCHDLRHRFASVFLQETGDLPALQAILGHRSIEMTMRYSHLLTDNLHRAVARAGTKLGTSVPSPPSSAPPAPLTEEPISVGVSWTATASFAMPLNGNGSVPPTGTVDPTVLNEGRDGPVAQQDRAAVS
ncbi:site-specific integrase [Salinarimonas rosea]|uniref:tyrosine-type recombinase/integrase n=1 Tax=Salinarimonas rosea TaxID=552063 RepID=UPI0009FB996C